MPGPDNTPGGYGVAFDARTLSLLAVLLVAAAALGALITYLVMR
jgi:hypothetical protein